MIGRLAQEDQLCLLISRGQLTADEQVHAREFLGAPVQWPLLLERAYTNQAYPLVYRNVRQLGLPAVPDAVQTSLKGVYLANALHNQGTLPTMPQENENIADKFGLYVCTAQH
ncbi:MAG: hypothetical protein ABSE40_20845 [Candidatus Sulfotelmatobacter sp.]